MPKCIALLYTDIMNEGLVHLDLGGSFPSIIIYDGSYYLPNPESITCEAAKNIAAGVVNTEILMTYHKAKNVRSF